LHQVRKITDLAISADTRAPLVENTISWIKVWCDVLS
jgi:hypothetical protein